MTINIKYTTILELKVRKHQFLLKYYLGFARFLKFALKYNLLSQATINEKINKINKDSMESFIEIGKLRKEIKQEIGEWYTETKWLY